ncbi:MAG: YtxH domain-containing protein [Paludibaculum sp.]
MVVAGVAVGATIALLFAPSSGRVTRRRISRAAERGRESLADTGRDLADKGRDLYEKGRRLADEAADMIDRGKKLVEG